VVAERISDVWVFRAAGWLVVYTDTFLGTKYTFILGVYGQNCQFEAGGTNYGHILRAEKYGILYY